MNANAADLLTQRPFLTAAGTETWMLFQQQFPMREFCAFEIFDDEDALAELETNYLHPLISTVADSGHGLLLDALVWRAQPDHIAAIGRAADDIERINALAVARTKEALEAWRGKTGRDAEQFPVLITADLGPRGDGYCVGDGTPSVEAARRYHDVQLQALAGTGVDLVCALTMTNANESIGLVRAAGPLGLPIIVSATVETDGRLPDGSRLADFVRRVDDETAGAPLYYMVNCAHPTHLEPTLASAASAGEPWLDRLGGFRANSSKKSHEELDNSTELDRGNPSELGAELVAMRDRYGLRILGGCCGTDVEHIEAIARAAG